MRGKDGDLNVIWEALKLRHVFELYFQVYLQLRPGSAGARSLDDIQFPEGAACLNYRESQP
jgi:hypothetical protein